MCPPQVPPRQRRAQVAVWVATLALGCATSHVGPEPPNAAFEEALDAELRIEAAVCEEAALCALDVLDDHFSFCAPAELIERSLRARYGSSEARVDDEELARCFAELAGDCGGGEHRGLSVMPSSCARAVTFGPLPCGGSCGDGLHCAAGSDRCEAWSCQPLPTVGEVCSGASGCASPYRCAGLCVECELDDHCPITSVCRGHACVPASPEGTPCGAGVSCGRGLHCDGVACTPLGEDGAACAHDGACVDGLSCVSGRCGSLRAEGEPCSGGACLEGLRCGDDDVCVPLGRDGEACEGGSARWPQGTCAPDHRCDDGRCRPAVAGDVCDDDVPCSPLAPYCSGDRCNTEPIGIPCGDGCPEGARCAHPLDLCVVVRPVGGACDGFGHACEGGRCVDGTCIDVVAPHEACGADRLCPPRWNCIDARCQLAPRVGERCDPALAPCASGVCARDGICRWKLPGEPCTSYDECEHGCMETCQRGQTELGGPCHTSEWGECAEGMDCDRSVCVAACP